MRIREIEVRDFRKLRHVIVSGLKDGINIISGENETGKSTLLAAVQAALFQRHNVTGKVLDEMQPFGCSVRPQVKLGFEVNRGTYQLRKVFGGSGGSAEVVDPSGLRFSNQDADHKLEELLNFQAASRGGTKFHELGIWPLFWVEQGTTFQAVNINPGVRATVQSSLRKEVGDILVGESGSRLKDRFADLYSGFFTSKTGAATGELSASRKEVLRLEALLSNKQSELAELGQDMAALEASIARREKLTDPTLRDRLERLKAEAMLEAHALEALDQQRKQADQDLRLKHAVLKNAQGAREQRQALIKELLRLEQKLTGCQDADEVAKGNLEQREAELRARIENLDSARNAVKVATSERVLIGRVLELVKVSASHTAIVHRHTDAASAADKEAAARKIAAAIRVTAKDVQDLRKLEQALFEAEANLAAAATRIEFDIQEPSKLTVNLGPIPPSREMLATDVTSISIAAIGEIRVCPGGEGLDSRRQLRVAAQDRMTAALAELGVLSVQLAHELDQERRDAESAINTHKSVVQALAPNGLNALYQEASSQEGQIQTLRRILGDVELPDLNSATAAVAVAEGHEQHCRSDVERIDAEVGEVRTARDGARSLKTTKETELRTTIEDSGRCRETLATARTVKADDGVIQEANHAEADERSASEAHTGMEDRYKNKDPEGIALRVTTTSEALNSLEEQIADAERSISKLRVTLDVLGQKGLGEECAAIESDLNAARVRLTFVEQEANAVRVAYNMIVQVENEANTQFLQPVVRRVQPYLNRVIPGSLIQLGTDMTIAGLQRGTVTEPFECLSVGAREQLSMITRIAFADLLADEGVDAPIILDDALVYADEGRFGDALATLAFAAKRHQIIILTCHEHRYLGLAGPAIRLQEQERLAVP